MKKMRTEEALVFAKEIGCVDVEQERHWAWVYDNLKNDKEKREKLKAAGFKFSGKRCAWCYNEEQKLNHWMGKRTKKKARTRKGNDVLIPELVDSTPWDFKPEHLESRKYKSIA
jgi:hypothetical protein